MANSMWCVDPGMSGTFVGNNCDWLLQGRFLYGLASHSAPNKYTLFPFSYWQSMGMASNALCRFHHFATTPLLVHLHRHQGLLRG